MYFVCATKLFALPRTPGPTLFDYFQDTTPGREIPKALDPDAKQHPRPFCRLYTAVLDCANGYQKENEEEVNQLEEKCGQEVAVEAARTEAANSEEVGKEESHSQ